MDREQKVKDISYNARGIIFEYLVIEELRRLKELPPIYKIISNVSQKMKTDAEKAAEHITKLFEKTGKISDVMHATDDRAGGYKIRRSNTSENNIGTGDENINVEAKTDILLFVENQSHPAKISVKMAGKVQLSSAGSKTTENIICAAYMKTINKPGAQSIHSIDSIIDSIRKLNGRYVTEKNEKRMDAASKKDEASRSKSEEKLSKQRMAIGNDMSSYKGRYTQFVEIDKPTAIAKLTILLDNTDFKEEFIMQAMTGKTLFKNNTNSIAKFVASPNGCNKIDRRYVRSIAGKVTVRVSTKSDSGVSRPAIRIDIDSV